jgi:hypothetical protein
MGIAKVTPLDSRGVEFQQLSRGFDELGELINDAIQNWDKDPIIRKLLWTR